jgi:hypothetical protein
MSVPFGEELPAPFTTLHFSDDLTEGCEWDRQL